MLSFNKYKGGKPIAITRGGKKERTLYLYEDAVSKDALVKDLHNDLGGKVTKEYLDEMIGDINYHSEINLENEQFVMLPEPGRSVNFYASKSGSGKSYQIADFVEQYHKMHPKNEIFLVSSKAEGEDPAYYPRFKDIIQYVDFTKLTKPLDHRKFKDVLFIFDDTETITQLDDDDEDYHRQSKKKLTLEQVMHRSKEKILKNGRANNISVCITSHHVQDGHLTRDIIMESKKIIIYPKFITGPSLTRYIKTYEGFEKDTTTEIIKERKSRWLAISREGIKYILTAYKCKIIED